MERERRGLFGMESNATLPADWKHQEPPKDQGMSTYYVICHTVNFNLRICVEAWANPLNAEIMTFYKKLYQTDYFWHVS